MGKRLVAVGIVVVVVLGLPVLAAVTLPAGFFTQSVSQSVNFSPLGYATLTAGRGILTSRNGTDIVRWGWCPVQGLTSLCVSATGTSGFLQGVMTVSGSGFNIQQVKFTGLDAALLGIPGLVAGGELGGELENLNYHWADRCLQRGLISATGAVLLSGVDGDDYRVIIKGDGRQGFTLGGDVVEGTLEVAENRMSGRLKVTTPAQLPNIGSPMEVNVARHVGCR